jgi:hydrogenase nickel incorporation protein HypB
MIDDPPVPGLGPEHEARAHRGRTDPTKGTGTHAPGAGPGPDRSASADPAPPSPETVEIHQDLLAANDRCAADIRRVLAEHQVFAANLMSSPGSGKTALLEATLSHLAGRLRLAVIEGDIETTADADRLSPFGIPVVQINTGPFGGDCHLAAPLVERAVGRLDLHALDVLVVENVGNLVCPAEFDIGEDRKVVLLSVTEGEDKPLKYPLMFHEAALVLITKIDLLPHLEVDLGLMLTNIRRANPSLPALLVSARTGEGVAGWIAWLEEGLAAKREA